jgi:hypothetical protein
VTEEKKKSNPDREAISSLPLAKMSFEERREIQRLVQRALDEHNLPKFRAALIKLGYDESSDAYGKLMRLWDEHDRASRHG